MHKRLLLAFAISCATLPVLSDELRPPALVTTAPTIGTCAGTTTNGTITASNGPASFDITIGTGTITNSCSVVLPATAKWWNCTATNQAAPTATVYITKQSVWSATGATFVNYTDVGASTSPWLASQVLSVSCFPH